MKLKPIKTKKDYEDYLKWASRMFEAKVKRNTPEGDALEVILILIKQYEDEKYPIPSPGSVSYTAPKNK